MLPYTFLRHNKGFTPTPKHFGVGLQSERGFTLLETLVAIIILVSAIVGALSLASQSLSAAFVARDQITAFYLASEAIEYVRNKRDSNILEGKEWLDGHWDLDKCLGPRVCTVDAWDEDVDECPGAHDTCPLLRYDPIRFVYRHGGSYSETVFKRSMIINESVPGVEAEITVTISWKTKSLNRSITIRENIFNWQRNF